MADYLNEMKEYWNGRFENEEKIWGECPSKTAEYALGLFKGRNIIKILVPGAGYGRNSRFFSKNGYSVSAVEISDEALRIAESNDKNTVFYNSSIMDVTLEQESFDAIYCYNFLHLFRENERKSFIDRCYFWLKDDGFAFFTVFSNKEKSFGKGNEIEKNTFESKPGRPVHYFTEQDLKEHFLKFNILETGVMEETENHGDEGEHSHLIAYILVQKKKAFEFDGEKYKKASKHQKEWGNRIISEFKLKGNERILDLGCGDGVLTEQLAMLVPEGSALGIDASSGMIGTAKKLEGGNLGFKVQDINNIDYTNEFDVIFSNATLHWVKNHSALLASCYKALKKGGVIRFNFAGEGNCSHFFRVVQEAMNTNEFRKYFENFEWPWYMPDVSEYRALTASFSFNGIKVWEENADRYFATEEEMVKWIEQPSIVPFLKPLDERTAAPFRDVVVENMLKLSKQPDGRCFETFRRINMSAEK